MVTFKRESILRAQGILNWPAASRSSKWRFVQKKIKSFIWEKSWKVLDIVTQLCWTITPTFKLRLTRWAITSELLPTKMKNWQKNSIPSLRPMKLSDIDLTARPEYKKLDREMINNLPIRIHMLIGANLLIDNHKDHPVECEMVWQYNLERIYILGQNKNNYLQWI